MDIQTQKNYYSSLQAVLNQALDQALTNNENQFKTWKDYKAAHEKVKKGLKILPQELTTNCMVPIGRKALMKGKLVHTNEILVCLGAQYFAKYSAKQAIGVCDRRIKQADEMLSSLEKERNLLEMRRSMPTDYGVFGDDEKQEIIEPYVEEEEQQWRIEHRQREKEYRKKLAELRGQDKTEIRSEEDLWQRLDELELQEELEDEIDRLQYEDCNYYGEDAQDDENSYEDDDDDNDSEFSEDETTIDQLREGLAKLKNVKESKQEKYLLETENSDEVTDRKSSPASNINDIPQPSTSNNSNESIVQLKSIGKRINGSESGSSLSFLEDQISGNDEKTTNKNAEFTSEDSQDSFNHSSEASAVSSKTKSSDSTNLTNVYLNENLSYQCRKNVSDQLVTSTRKEEGEFPRESNNQINRRRVSFTDKIQVNVFEKLDHSSGDKEKQGGECSYESNAGNKINKRNQFSNDENTDVSRDNEDEDDIIKIEVKHSDIKPRKQFKNNEEDVIEDPSDIYRIFFKPKSILKRSSGDYKNFIPQPEDISNKESEESFAESSYTIIVKDVEERNPEVLQINNTASKGRPVSRFKMARSGMK